MKLYLNSSSLGIGHVPSFGVDVQSLQGISEAPSRLHEHSRYLIDHQCDAAALNELEYSSSLYNSSSQL